MKSVAVLWRRGTGSVRRQLWIGVGSLVALQQNAALAEQLTAAAQSLQQRAGELQGIIGGFRVAAAPVEGPTSPAAAALSELGAAS